MIPISDVNQTRRPPVVNWTLIAINVVVFFYELSLRSRQLDNLISTWGVVPTQILSALAHPFQTSFAVWGTLITSQFLHAGWLHIIGNMLFLWVFGDNVEDILGHFLYLIFYLGSGIAAGIAQTLIQGASTIPSIGASGAIAGVLGGYVLLYPWARVNILLPVVIFVTTIQVPALIVIGWWFVQQFFYGVMTISESSVGGVAFWAHIGGFVAGMILILPFLGRPRRGRPVYNYSSLDDRL